MRKYLLFLGIVLFLTVTGTAAFSQSAEEWNDKGKNLYNEGKYNDAIACFKKALELAPNAHEIWLNLGNTYFKIGNFEKACGCYNESLKYKPEWVRALTNKGRALMKLVRYGEAKVCFEMVLAQNPNDVDVQSYLEEVKELLAGQPSPEVTPVTSANNYTSPSGIEMVFIPGGTFQMGDKALEWTYPHKVEVSSFYMSKYEITNRQFNEFSPSHENYGCWSEPDYPVEAVDWFDALKYCNWLSEQEGLTPCYSDGGNDTAKIDINANGYRIPTEAQWEYAYRGGTTTTYYWGPDMNDSYCWYEDNSGGHPHPVGKTIPNNLGLYDMSGNVWEWCWDYIDNDYYYNSPYTDPLGPPSGEDCVVRGGGWESFPTTCNSFYRGQCNPNEYTNCCGFRVVRMAQ